MSDGITLPIQDEDIVDVSTIDYRVSTGNPLYTALL